MISLPSITLLKQRCQALAALDLILSPEWEGRYFSFNAKWSAEEQMASMRNGCGDEWFCLFHTSGWAAIKGLDHESKAWANGGKKLSAALRSGIPDSPAAFSVEPAFRWDATTFAFYCMNETASWVRVADSTEFGHLIPTGEEEYLAMLNGSAEQYVAHAGDYFEREIDAAVVTDIFSLRPISEASALRLNPDAEWSCIETELFEEICYPRG